MKAADLREKTVDDLSELQKSLANDVFRNRLKNFTNRLDDTSAIRKTKRDLARVVTVLRERELVVARAEASEVSAVEPTAAASRSAARDRGPAAEAEAVAAPEATAKKSAPKKAAAGGDEATDAPKKKSPKKSAKSEAK